MNGFARLLAVTVALALPVAAMAQTPAPGTVVPQTAAPMSNTTNPPPGAKPSGTVPATPAQPGSKSDSSATKSNKGKHAGDTQGKHKGADKGQKTGQDMDKTKTPKKAKTPKT